MISPDAPEGTVIVLNMSAITGQYSAEESITLTVGTAKEDFETGDFSQFNWQHADDAYWFVTDSIAHTGNYSAQCGHIIKNQKTSLIIEITNMTDGELGFYYKVNTKYRKDYLVIYIDGKISGFYTGDIDWTFASFQLPAGQHTVKWCYDTAPNGGTEGNVCWIDDITFPGNTVILDVETVIENKEYTVYPNPANDVIFIKGEEIQFVEIYNSIGMRVISKNVNASESINIADLASGMYFVRILDKKGNISTTKIVKR